MRTDRLRRAGRKRGSVLLHVMLTAVVVALIAATLLRMALLRANIGGRGVKALQEKRSTQGALAGILAGWNSVNATCANNVAGYNCGGSATPPTPGTCGCTCTPTNPADPTIYTSGTADKCRLTIVSIDIP